MAGTAAAKHLGVAGAALATVLSMAIVSAVTGWWLFGSKQTYVSFRFRGFRFDRFVVWDIARVGLPATASHASMSVMAFALTRMVSEVGGPRGVAVYTTGWRVISMATLPVLGMASAVTAVVGAAYGARAYDRMRTAFRFALKLGMAAEAVLALIIFAFAPQITWIFTWSKASEGIIQDLVVFLRTLFIFLPTVPVGMLSAGLFQGTGKGLHALTLTLIRTLAFTVPFAWFLGIYLEGGLEGIWKGMVAAGLAYIPIAYVWADRYTRRLLASQA